MAKYYDQAKQFLFTDKGLKKKYNCLIVTQLSIIWAWKHFLGYLPSSNIQTLLNTHDSLIKVGIEPALKELPPVSSPARFLQKIDGQIIKDTSFVKIHPNHVQIIPWKIKHLLPAQSVSPSKQGFTCMND